MKVTSTETLSFPQFNWGIHAGETRELPADKEAEKAILGHASISEAKESKAGASAPKN